MCISFVGQKPVLTDVQAELDRISRKPEMVSPTSPTSPTEGEASWRHQIKPIVEFSGVIQTCLCLFLQWLELKNWNIVSEHKQFVCLSFMCCPTLQKGAVQVKKGITSRRTTVHSARIVDKFLGFVDKSV